MFGVKGFILVTGISNEKTLNWNKKIPKSVIVVSLNMLSALKLNI